VALGTLVPLKTKGIAMEQHLKNLIAYLKENSKTIGEPNNLRYFIQNGELLLEFKYDYAPQARPDPFDIKF
jgi:uncharacterized protein YkuJ